MAPKDNRVKHGNHKKRDPELVQSVKDHINSVPRIESHYLRANTSREFIDGGPIAELHHQCDLCESFKNAVGEGKDKLLLEYELHQREKQLSRNEKSKDIETCNEANSNTLVFIYDLQAVMPKPIGESSAFYYKSKLNCLNFTISD
ncbi:unnamed protein product, partial [Brenthis ino]